MPVSFCSIDWLPIGQGVNQKRARVSPVQTNSALTSLLKCGFWAPASPPEGGGIGAFQKPAPRPFCPSFGSLGYRA